MMKNRTEQVSRMKELISTLNEASRAYYAEDREIMSNFEYDALYDELEMLQEESGIILANSPTEQVGYEVAPYLEEEAHEQRMLSLDKTKDAEALAAFAGSHKTLLSWKLDGLTVVLTYENGRLLKAVTRGNGSVGEVVTANAKAFQNLPSKISFPGRLVLRGEAIIHYSDFERINAALQGVKELYKNPRNLCSGSVRQLDSQVTAKRSVYFYAFSLVQADGMEAAFEDSHENELLWLKEQGFDIVEYRVMTGQTAEDAIAYFSRQIAKNDFPSDGLVALYDSISYGAALGTTAKFPRNALAFKWADEVKETTLLKIEWSPSRTGLLNPVAVFEPVELEGTSVSRASVHNVSIVKQLELGEGDRLLVYKANMIIPQIAENLTRSGHLEIPSTCPVCEGETRIISSQGVETLICTNPDCPAKHMKAFTLFVSRDAMDIEGLSEATLTKFMSRGFLKTYADLYRLDRHKDDIVEMEGFGILSYEKLIKGIEKSKNTVVSRLIYALGIPGVGIATARLIARAFHEDLDLIAHADIERLCRIDGIGEVTARDFSAWWENEENKSRLDDLLRYLRLEKEFSDASGEPGKMEGMTFVITGSVRYFANRKELQALIEENGGKVSSSVSKNTDYLINNDVASASSKNKKARELEIPILSEENFLDLFKFDRKK